ncbi:MAG: saccharopine dehydrogenase NADP-binding domain-containing protein [Gemmatimonadota bacterium]|nr:saccharopine dehydrogenase NADP-binding domain-containing protein [Gemmatimonadota bacterium]
MILIYGANGYTGRLIARRAASLGIRVVLAGRDGASVAALAGELGMEQRAFGLDDPAALKTGIAGATAVLHCAGPFSRTAVPMATACIDARVHYVDITGETSVFEAMAARSDAARAAGVMLLPGAGFDVVPSDCLAAHLKARLPTATKLTLAFQALGGMSRGTATTMVENIERGGLIRTNGVLTPVPAAWKTRRIDYGRRPTQSMTIPWGDVATAYYSTGIGNIEVYTAVSDSAIRAMRLSRHLGWLLGSTPMQKLLRAAIRRRAPGPSDARRERSYSLLWGEVEDEQGRRASARMRTPDGYTLTSITALEIARRASEGNAKPGFQTPSLAYGADLILEVTAGVERWNET